jgi:hypothetical protein
VEEKEEEKVEEKEDEDEEEEVELLRRNRAKDSTAQQEDTGVLILQNAKGLFLSQDLARANYQAELAEILHGTLLGDSTWVNRGVF